MLRKRSHKRPKSWGPLPRMQLRSKCRAPQHKPQDDGRAVLAANIVDRGLFRLIRNLQGKCLPKGSPIYLFSDSSEWENIPQAV